MSNNLESDITLICHSFPECALFLDSQCYVKRDNILDTIEKALNDTQLVFIEGEEGIGKTSIIIQYANRHKESICLFVRSTSRWGFDPEILRYDLCNQINYILYGKELSIDQVDETYFNTNVINLSRHAKRTKKVYYFLIDGLEDLDESNIIIRDSLIQMLPLGVANFRFLITGSPELIAHSSLNRLIMKSIVLSGFTFDEAKTFLVIL